MYHKPLHIQIRDLISDLYLETGRTVYWPSDFENLGEQMDILEGLYKVLNNGELESYVDIVCPDGHTMSTFHIHNTNELEPLFKEFELNECQDCLDEYNYNPEILISDCEMIFSFELSSWFEADLKKKVA